MSVTFFQAILAGNCVANMFPSDQSPQSVINVQAQTSACFDAIQVNMNVLQFKPDKLYSMTYFCFLFYRTEILYLSMMPSMSNYLAMYDNISWHLCKYDVIYKIIICFLHYVMNQKPVEMQPRNDIRIALKKLLSYEHFLDPINI